MTKKSSKGIVAAVLVIVVLGLAVRLYRTRSDQPAVYTTTVAIGDVQERVSGTGMIRPLREVKISSEIMGKIVDLRVREGDGVNEEDLLLEIDASRYRSIRDKAKATLRSAEMTLQLEQSRLDQIEKDHHRTESLFRQEIVSFEQMDAVGTQLDIQRLRLEIAKESVLQAWQALSASEDDFSKTRIRSPISGVVTDLRVSEGETVIQGTMNNPGTVIMTVSNLAEMEVRLFLDEIDIVKIRDGQRVDIWVDAFPDTVLSGVVHSVGYSSSSGSFFGNEISDENASFRVGILLDENLSALKPGMMATVEIVTDIRRDVHVVPLQSIVLGSVDVDDLEKGQGVYRIDGNRCAFQPVKSGLSDERYIEIDFPGIEKGIHVVSGPYRIMQRLSHGETVKVLEG